MHQILDGGSRDRYRKEQEKQLKNLQIALEPDRFAGEEPAALHASIQRMPELKDQWGNPMALEDAEKDARGIVLVSSNGTGIRRQPTMKENFQTLAQGAADAADALDENVWYPAEQGMWANLGDFHTGFNKGLEKMSGAAHEKGWDGIAHFLKQTSQGTSPFYEFEKSARGDAGHAPEPGLQRMAYNAGYAAPEIALNNKLLGPMWSAISYYGASPKNLTQSKRLDRSLELTKNMVKDKLLEKLLRLRLKENGLILTPEAEKVLLLWKAMAG